MTETKKRAAAPAEAGSDHPAQEEGRHDVRTFADHPVRVRGGGERFLVRGLKTPDICTFELGGEPCKKPAPIEVFGNFYCEVHGEEAAHAALESYWNKVGDEWGELQSADAFSTLRLPEVSEVIDGHVRRCNFVEGQHVGYRLKAAQAAFPFGPGAVSKLTEDYERDLEGGVADGLPDPEDYYQDMMGVVLKAMHEAFYMDNEETVDRLEEVRRYAAAQAEYARVIGERRFESTPGKKGGNS